MENKKRKCYYSKHGSIYEKFNMLDEFINYCENEAVKTVFLSSWKNKKRIICGSGKCLKKAMVDLNILRQESKNKLAIAKKVKRLRIVGLSDSEIYKDWDKLN